MERFGWNALERFLGNACDTSTSRRSTWNAEPSETVPKTVSWGAFRSTSFTKGSKWNDFVEKNTRAGGPGIFERRR
jgi:hypothetical protein